MSTARVADILATLVEAGPSSSWPERLVEECRQATEMTGVGLALMGGGGAAGILAATSGHAQKMEDLQFALGEGPCVDATRLGRPVLCADLALHGDARWPAFSPEAQRAGVAAAFTFPLQVGSIGLGVLDLYRDSRGPLTAPQVTEAVAFADASVAVLLHLQGDGSATSWGNGRHPDGTALGILAQGEGAAVPELAGLVDRRAVVHQAAGMISVQLDVDVAEALLRLRAYAYALDRPMADVAADVVARRLRFDNSEEGATELPGPPDPDGSRRKEPGR